MDLEQVKRRIEIIDKLQKQVKDAKAMLADALENDSEYQKVAEEAKVANSKKKQLKDEVFNVSGNKQIVNEIKENSEEIVTLKEILSEELIEYREQNKTETIEDIDGKMRYFKLSVKLVNKQGEFDNQQQ
jgi:hypothetical protein